MAHAIVVSANKYENGTMAHVGILFSIPVEDRIPGVTQTEAKSLPDVAAALASAPMKAALDAGEAGWVRATFCFPTGMSQEDCKSNVIRKAPNFVTKAINQFKKQNTLRGVNFNIPGVD